MSLKYSPSFFFGSLLYFGCNVNASAAVYCNILWSNNTPPQAVLNATLDGSVSNTFPLELSVGGASTAITQYQEDIPTTNPVKGIVRYWVQYPTDWITSPEGLRYRISSTLGTAQSQASGVKTVVTPTKDITWQDIWGCNPVGSTYTFGATNLSGIYLEIDRGAAWPGVYSLSLPIAVAYEENKGNYNGDSGGGWKEYAEAMKNHGYIDSKNIQITITSKCDIKSRALNINLGHSITPEQARVGVNKQTEITVSCNAPANVEFSFQALHSINGAQNQTKCGSGVCTLSFDDGSAKKTYSFVNGQNRAVINTLFQTSNPEAGIFDGAAVLSMFVQ